MFRQLIAVARNSLLEAIRQPIYPVLLLLVSLTIVVCVPLAAYTFDDDTKFFVDMALPSIFLGSMLLAPFLAAGVISREIENKTVLTVISKPLPRPLLIVGKYLGLMIALTAAMWIWSCVFLLCLRHGAPQTASHKLDGPVWTFGGLAFLASVAAATIGNYLFSRNFGQTLTKWMLVGMTLAWVLILFIGKQWVFQLPEKDFRPQIMIALLLLGQAAWILGAVSTMVSTRAGTVVTLLFVIAFTFVCLLSDYWFGGALENPQGTLGNFVARQLHAIFNFQPLLLADAITQQNPVDTQYVLYVSSYAGLMIVAALALAVALFQTRQTS